MFREPIKIICINSRSSIKLIKGAIYFARSIHTNTHSKERRVYIDNVGYYLTKYFKLLDGSSLDSIQDFTIPRGKNLDTKSKNYIGEFIRCRYSSGKYLKEGEIYLVEEQRNIPIKNSKGVLTRYEPKLKLKGIKNPVCPYRFEEIELKDQRNIKLKKLNGDKIKTAEQTRKFLLYTEKEKIIILFEILTKILLDIKQIEATNQLDLIELMVKKGYKYALLKEDIIPFLNKNIEEILKIYNLKTISSP